MKNQKKLEGIISRSQNFNKYIPSTEQEYQQYLSTKTKL
jgi:hypothetical protein